MDEIFYAPHKPKFVFYETGFQSRCGDVFSCMVRPLIALVLFLAALVNSGMIYMFAPEMESS